MILTVNQITSNSFTLESEFNNSLALLDIMLQRDNNELHLWFTEKTKICTTSSTVLRPKLSIDKKERDQKVEKYNITKEKKVNILK